jgi:hypothetical protein
MSTHLVHFPFVRRAVPGDSVRSVPAVDRHVGRPIHH